MESRSSMMMSRMICCWVMVTIVLIRCHAQVAVVPPAATTTTTLLLEVELTTTVNSPWPQNCVEQEDCDQQAPCAVMRCESKMCVFVELRMSGVPCGGGTNLGTVCHCLGDSAFCMCQASRVTFDPTDSNANTNTVALSDPELHTTVFVPTSPRSVSPQQSPGLIGTQTQPVSTARLTVSSGTTRPKTSTTNDDEHETTTTRFKTRRTQPRSTSTESMTIDADVVDPDLSDVSRTAIIVGCVVGGCIGLICLLGAVALFAARRSRQIKAATTPPPTTATTTPPAPPSEYGRAPVFNEYGSIAEARPYDAPPSQLFSNYESARDPLQL
jgi:hypothetical protein